MKTMRKMLLIILSVLMVLLMSGCSVLELFLYTKKDAANLVRWNLDSMYLNQNDPEYLTSCGATEEEMQQSYEDGIEIEADYLINSFGIDGELLNTENKERAKQLCRDIYTHSKYEIGNTVKSGSDFLVDLTIYPIDIVQKFIEEDYDAFMEKYNKELENGSFDDMTDEDFANWWADVTITMLDERLDAIGYMDPTVISVHIVVQEADGASYHTISEDDWNRIDNAIIQY